jgi:aspartyl-tRNA(Asn)/glutamyl-tRNA(Gln) amidotransferase subunit C
MLAFGMPARFTRDDVVALAALASLDLTDEEIDRFAGQLGDFLGFAEEVQRVDTSGVPPTARVGAADAVERDDALVPSLDRARALANAPDAGRGAFFRVPRVLG